MYNRKSVFIIGILILMMMQLGTAQDLGSPYINTIDYSMGQAFNCYGIEDDLELSACQNLIDASSRKRIFSEYNTSTFDNRENAQREIQVGIDLALHEYNLALIDTRIRMAWAYVNLIFQIVLEFILIAFYLAQLYLVSFLIITVIPSVFIKIKEGMGGYYTNMRGRSIRSDGKVR